MSKKTRNHFIPRFLLKRFASRIQGNSSWIWQTSSGGDISEISTRDVCVKKHFYGKEDESIENRLRDIETNTARILLRIERGEEPIKYAQELRLFFFVQAFRTNAIRQQVCETTIKSAEKVVERATPDILRAVISKKLDTSFDEMMKEIIDELPREQRRVLKSNMKSQKQKRQILDKISGDMKSHETVDELYQYLKRMANSQKIQDANVQGQIKVLNRILFTEGIPEPFNPIYWRCIQIQDENLILGDNCILSLNDENEYTSFFKSGGSWRVLLLPISSELLLEASREKPIKEYSGESINFISARNSYEYVYSSNKYSALTKYIPEIGKDSKLLSDDKLEDLAEAVWSELT